MAGYSIDIETATEENEFLRKVLYRQNTCSSC